MSTSNLPSMTLDQLDALQSRFAMRVRERLNDDQAALPHDITERLRVARLQAVSAFAAARQLALAPQLHTAPSAAVWASGQVAMAGTGHHVNGTSHHPARGPADLRTGWAWRIACALPVLTLLMGLWGIHQWHQREEIQATADIDVALLTDKLPPAAYADAGFEEFLQTTANTPATSSESSTAPTVQSL